MEGAATTKINIMVELTKNNFIEFIKYSSFSVVLFSWGVCKPCIGVRKQLEPLERQIPCGIVEVSENLELADSLRIIGFPTLVLFKDGREVDRLKGYFTTAQLREWLNL